MLLDPYVGKHVRFLICIETVHGKFCSIDSFKTTEPVAESFARVRSPGEGNRHVLRRHRSLWSCSVSH